MLFRFSGKPVNEAIETEFQFSKILLNLGLQCSNRNYTVLHFKGMFLNSISCYSSNNSVPISYRITVRETHKVGGVDTRVKYFCGVR